MNLVAELLANHAPQGVNYRRLGDVSTIGSKRVDANSLDATMYVGVDNLVAGFGGRRDAGYAVNSSGAIAFGPGDILVGNIRPYLKKVWLADRHGGASPDVLVVEIERSWRDLLLPRFLHCLLASDAFIAYSMRHAKGAKMPRGSKAAILEYRIPLPPIEVQHEIVRILDDYTGLVTELEAGLEAELEARRRQYAHCRDRLLARSMPDQAAWRELGQVAEFKYGYTAQAIEAGDYRFLRITDIDNRGKLLVDGAKFVAGKQEVADYVVQPGDLLMARTGGTYGKTMLVSVDEPAVYASFLIRIRVDTSVMLPSYYWHFAQSDLYWKQARSMVSTGGQPQFNANVLKLVELPVPPIDEQRRIVGILDSFDALVHDLSIRLSAELAARRKQYEYYRDRLLTFEEAPV